MKYDFAISNEFEVLYGSLSQVKNTALLNKNKNCKYNFQLHSSYHWIMYLFNWHTHGDLFFFWIHLFNNQHFKTCLIIVQFNSILILFLISGLILSSYKINSKKVKTVNISFVLVWIIQSISFI